MEPNTVEQLERAIRADGRFSPAAYDFLQRGLEYATRMVYEDDIPEGPRHVTGQQLCEGLRRLALDTWGPLSPLVLASWNIRRTRDFGEMVFFLIGIGLMGRQKSDRVEDFDDVYDFRHAFDNYDIPLEHFDELK